MIIDLLLEGLLEEPVSRKIVAHTGHIVGLIYGREGVLYLRQRVRGIGQRASTNHGVLVLTDFKDSSEDCVPLALSNYLGDTTAYPPTFLLRFAVNTLESWLLADIPGFASFLRISEKNISSEPERLNNPKQFVVKLARKTRRTRLKDQLIPYKGHGGESGPGYFPVMKDFVENHWDIERARLKAPSLDRCLTRLQEL